MMRKVFLFLIFCFSALVIYLNVQLLSENYSRQEEKVDILRQLEFLKLELKQRGLGSRMQRLFPEGSVFVNTLYGLAWCELSLSYPDDPELNKRAIEEASFAFKEIDSEKCKGIFDQDLSPKYGIYYFGWRNYLLSKLLQIDPSLKNTALGIEYRNNCQQLTDIIQEKVYAESYEVRVWPADMCVAMASLSNYKNVYADNRYNSATEHWIKKVSLHLDPFYGLIPHQVDVETLEPIEGPRGCSQALILRLLAEIDPVFAAKQFQKSQELFVFTRLGLPAFREYPKGVNGEGDVDSGPVIFDVGFAGTIVMIGTNRAYGLKELADQQYKTINAFGFETTLRGRKKYIFGVLPMADAFIAWGRATSPKVNVSSNNSWSLHFFQLLSFGTLSLFWLIYFWPKIIQRIKRSTQ